MKLELHKIEATLHQLAAQSTTGNQELSLKSQPVTTIPEQPAPPTPKLELWSEQAGQAKRIPALPKIEQPRFTSHRNGVNPYLAMNLLKEMEGVVGRWQTELRQVLRQIQDIYMEGPIVEGWLETDYYTPTTAPGVPAVPKGNRGATKRSPAQNANSATRYRLCGWDASGALRSRPCPPEELPSVSLAIARYQKLQHLLDRKQELENNLTQLAEVLIVVQGHIQTL